jgi:hypothetical protein
MLSSYPAAKGMIKEASTNDSKTQSMEDIFQNIGGRVREMFVIERCL